MKYLNGLLKNLWIKIPHQVSTGKLMRHVVWLSQLPSILILTTLFGSYHLFRQGNFESSFYKNSIFPFLNVVDGKFTDMKFHARGPIKPKKNIVIVAIDSRSIEALGRWPWRRDYIAMLIDKIFSYETSFVGLDIVFSEPDERVPPEIKSYLLEQKQVDLVSAHNTDEILKSTMDIYNSKLIQGWMTETPCRPYYDSECQKYIISNELSSEIPDYFPQFSISSTLEQNGSLNYSKTPLMSALYPISNMTAFEQDSKNLGLLNISPDPDGTVRLASLTYLMNQKFYPLLPLALAQAILGQKAEVQIGKNGKISNIALGKETTISTSLLGEIGINFRGRGHSFPYISAIDLLSDEDQVELIGKAKTISKSELFKNSYVLVGTTALGIFDSRTFPFDENVPGVEGHATILDNLLSDDYLRIKTTLFEFMVLLLVMLFGGAFYSYTCGKLRPWPSFVLFMVLMTVTGIFDITVLFANNINYATSFLFLELLSIYVLTSIIKYVMADKGKRFLRSAFSNYISEELIERMYSADKLPDLGGSSRELTAYFTDIQGFSSFSEKLNPRELVSLLNEYLTEMTDALLSLNGTLDKYEGDAIIAFFGAPIFFDEHAKYSCLTALKMQSALKLLRDKWRTDGDIWPDCVKDMRMRIGINTGEMLIGNMGSKNRMNYTMMGDSVNLAARLEEAAKQYGVFVYISEYTYKYVDEEFVARKIDCIRVVGKSEPVTTYELLGETGKVSEEVLKLKELFDSAMTLYQEKEWEKAIKTFEVSLEFELHRFPDLVIPKSPSQVYIDRCKQFQSDPPPDDWDGVFVLTSK